MNQPRPTYCAYGDTGHLAAYRVETSTKSVVACRQHLTKAQKWAGATARTEPLHGHEPPPEQPALF